MKTTWFVTLLMLFTVSCASKKKSAKDEYTPVISFTEAGQKYEATVMLPKKFKDRVPLIIVVHEWWGRNDYIKKRATMLTEAGFAALPVDLFGNEEVVETPKEAQALATPFYKNPQISVDRLNKYLEAAKKDPHVDPNRIYLIGYCFGGSQALNLGRSGADVKGIVSFHGALQPLFPVARAPKAKFLVLNGAADPMVPPKDVKAFEKEMKAAGADLKVINYKGATHAFSNPKATEIGKTYNIPIAYNKEADEKSWKELLKFLK